jgi:hypothetical protein
MLVGRKAPLILNPDTSQKLVSFRPRPVYCWRSSPRYPSDKILVVLKISSWHDDAAKYLCRELNPGHMARSHLLYWLISGHYCSIEFSFGVKSSASCKNVQQSDYKPGQARGFQEVEAPRFQDSRHCVCLYGLRANLVLSLVPEKFCQHVPP